MCLKGIGIGGSYPTIQAKRNGEGRTLDTISSYVAPSGSHPGIEKFVKPINYNSDDVVTWSLAQVLNNCDMYMNLYFYMKSF